MLIIHNEELRKRIKSDARYTLREIQEIRTLLEDKGTLEFSALANGLFPAARVNKETEYTGYANVWVRDNVHVAHAHYAVGDIETAVKNVNALMTFFRKYQRRFKDTIESGIAPKDPMKRPHIRFNGQRLVENRGAWAHAQNDALGYFLWFYAVLANQEIIEIHRKEMNMLALFALYFKTIRYWKDEDSGHWEETRKICASSIGVVVAALREFQQLLRKTSFECKYKNESVAPMLAKLINNGKKSLRRILPRECIQEESSKNRRYDAALLFLIYPLQVVGQPVADRILGNVIDNLQGDYGIRRYVGDSFWAPDYKKKLQPERRTSHCGYDISSRDALLPKKGSEAQWCIFDPIISVIYGTRFQKTGNEEFLDKQIHHLNRSLGQITKEFECPELYYLEDNQYVPGDVAPLLWTQANLRIALKIMEKSLQSTTSQTE